MREIEVKNNYSVKIGDTLTCRPTMPVPGDSKTHHIVILEEKFYSPHWFFKNEPILLTEKYYGKPDDERDFIIDIYKQHLIAH